MTAAPLVMPTIPVMSNEITAWLENLRAGTAESAVMSDGKGYFFNCDSTAHYLYENDMTRREPNGRYKRVYKGKVEGRHVTYKETIREIPCPNAFERWEKARHVNICRIPKGTGGDEGRTRPDEGRHVTVAGQDDWRETRTPPYLN